MAQRQMILSITSEKIRAHHDVAGAVEPQPKNKQSCHHEAHEGREEFA
jgi:hypothetical protein